MIDQKGRGRERRGEEKGMGEEKEIDGRGENRGRG